MIAKSPDLFLNYDKLHPSEKVYRVVAGEFFKRLDSWIKYTTYYKEEFVHIPRKQLLIE